MNYQSFRSANLLLHLIPMRRDKCDKHIYTIKNNGDALSLTILFFL